MMLKFDRKLLTLALVVAVWVIICAVIISPTLEIISDLSSKQERIRAQKFGRAPGLQSDTLVLEHLDPSKKSIECIYKTANSHGVNVSKIDTPFTTTKENVTVVTQQITLAGSFTDLLKCVTEVETVLMPVKISSLKFIRSESSDKKSGLTMTVYFQAIKADNEKKY